MKQETTIKWFGDNNKLVKEVTVLEDGLVIEIDHTPAPDELTIEDL